MISYVGDLAIPDLFPPTQNLLVTLKPVLEALNDFILAANAYIKAVTELISKLNELAEILVVVEAGFDFMAKGLAPLKLNAALEFQGSLRAMANLSISMGNPLGAAMASITAMATAMASLKASLALGLPTLSAELTAQLSAIAAVSAAAAAKMASIQALIDALLSFLNPLLHAKELVATLTASLSVSVPLFQLDTLDAVRSLVTALTVHLEGPGVYTYAGETTYSALQGVLGAPPSGLSSATAVKALVFLVDPGTNPSTWANLQFLVRTTP